MKYARKIGIASHPALVSIVLAIQIACAPVVPVDGAPPPWGDDKVQSDMVDFTVDNSGFEDAKLYIVRGGTSYRFSTVRGLSRGQKVRLRRSDLDAGGCIVMLVSPFPSVRDETWASDRVCVHPGNRLELWINPMLQASSLVAWPVR